MREPTRLSRTDEGPHDHEQQHREQPALPARRAQPGGREHRAQQQDHRQLQQLLQPLRALVRGGVELVVGLVAAEGDAAGEHAEEAVAAEHLGEAVDDERGGDRVEAVVVGQQHVGAVEPLDAPGGGDADRRADRDPDRDGVDDVGGEPLDDPAAAVPCSATKTPARMNGAREAVVEPGLGGEREVRLVLVLVARRADADVARQHRVRRRERRAEQQRRGRRRAEQPGAEQRHERDRDRHREHEQARDRAPVARASAAGPASAPRRTAP